VRTGGFGTGAPHRRTPYNGCVTSRSWGRLAVAAMAAGALLVAGRVLPLREWVAQFQAWIAGLGFAGMLLFAAAYAGGTLLLAPVWFLTVVAGLTYPFWTAFALVSAVSTLSAALAFGIARRFARSRVEELARRDARLAAVDRAVAREGWKVVFLLRLSPLVPFAISNYVYGITAVAFGPFLLASWIGMLPGTFLYVSLGAAGRAAVGDAGGKTPAEWAVLGIGLAATVAVTAFVGRAAKRELAKARLGLEERAS
jgi:uncharacterized membrane protein YdjX (TVP38/TMEM64 family)